MGRSSAGEVEAELVQESEAIVGEVPLWHAKTQTLYWIDAMGASIHRFNPETGKDSPLKTPGNPGFIAFREPGGLMAGIDQHLYSCGPTLADWQKLRQAEHLGNSLNDGRPDAAGRLWIGSMNETELKPTGALYRFDPDGTLCLMHRPITTGNGIAWSPDNQTLYFADSGLSEVYAFDFDLEEGRIGSPRVFVKIPPEEGAPDGLCVDRSGSVWIAHWGGAMVTCHRPDGTRARKISVPVPVPTCPGFGGPKMSTLYITSARYGMSPEKLGAHPLSGSLFAVELDDAEGIEPFVFNG